MHHRNVNSCTCSALAHSDGASVPSSRAFGDTTRHSLSPLQARRDSLALPIFLLTPPFKWIYHAAWSRVAASCLSRTGPSSCSTAHGRTSLPLGRRAHRCSAPRCTRLEVEPHGVSKEVTKQCTDEHHYLTLSVRRADDRHRDLEIVDTRPSGAVPISLKVEGRELYTWGKLE